jgi:hypothetical protein
LYTLSLSVAAEVSAAAVSVVAVSATDTSAADASACDWAVSEVVEALSEELPQAVSEAIIATAIVAEITFLNLFIIIVLHIFV